MLFAKWRETIQNYFCRPAARRVFDINEWELWNLEDA